MYVCIHHKFSLESCPRNKFLGSRLTLTVPDGRSLSTAATGCGLEASGMKPTVKRNIWSKLMVITSISICFVPGFGTWEKERQNPLTYVNYMYYSPALVIQTSWDQAKTFG